MASRVSRMFKKTPSDQTVMFKGYRSFKQFDSRRDVSVLPQHLVTVRKQVDTTIGVLDGMRKRLDGYFASTTKQAAHEKELVKYIKEKIETEKLLDEDQALTRNILENYADALRQSNEKWSEVKVYIDDLMLEYEKSMDVKIKLKDSVGKVNDATLHYTTIKNKMNSSTIGMDDTDLDDAQSRVDACTDQLAIDLYNFLGKEAKLVAYYEKFCKHQADYHRATYEAFDKSHNYLAELRHENNRKLVTNRPLEDHLAYEQRRIALPIEACCFALIEFDHMTQEGIFRINGMQTKITKLTAAFDVRQVHLEEFRYEPHAIAGALKSYLRNLNHKLIPVSDDRCCEITRMNKEDKRRAIKQLLADLPTSSYDNLAYLIRFVELVAAKHSENKMTANNLAIVFAPNLITGGKDDMQFAPFRAVFIECLINDAKYYFPDDISFTRQELYHLCDITPHSLKVESQGGGGVQELAKNILNAFTALEFHENQPKLEHHPASRKPRKPPAPPPPRHGGPHVNGTTRSTISDDSGHGASLRGSAENLLIDLNNSATSVNNDHQHGGRQLVTPRKIVEEPDLYDDIESTSSASRVVVHDEMKHAKAAPQVDSATVFSIGLEQPTETSSPPSSNSPIPSNFDKVLKPNDHRDVVSSTNIVSLSVEHPVHYNPGVPPLASEEEFDGSDDLSFSTLPRSGVAAGVEKGHHRTSSLDRPVKAPRKTVLKQPDSQTVPVSSKALERSRTMAASDRRAKPVIPVRSPSPPLLMSAAVPLRPPAPSKENLEKNSVVRSSFNAGKSKSKEEHVYEAIYHKKAVDASSSSSNDALNASDDASDVYVLDIPGQTVANRRSMFEPLMSSSPIGKNVRDSVPPRPKPPVPGNKPKGGNVTTPPSSPAEEGGASGNVTRF